MPLIIQILAAIGFIAILGVLGNFDLADEYDREAQSKQLIAERASGRNQPLLTHPLPCDAWVAQSGPGDLAKPRCYIAKSKK